MLTAIYSILIFLVLITVHEFGHFAAAKLSGVTVLEFAVGMGPAIFKKERNGTLYSVRILPVGGYCKMEGEDEQSESDGALSNKPAWKRLIVIIAGATMNIILGFIIFVIVMFSTPKISAPVIDSVLENSPAQVIGLQEGDRIIKVNSEKINTFSDLSFQLSRYKSGEINIEYLRDSEKKTVILTPIISEQGNYIIGFVPATIDLNFGSRIQNAYYQTIFMSKLVLVSFGDLITGKVQVNQLSGPVGIVSGIGTAAKEGTSSLLFFTALITINLGVFNLLPIPALDGGRMFFIIIEMIRRKKIPPEKEGLIHAIGFALLILLMIFTTSNDIFKIFIR